MAVGDIIRIGGNAAEFHTEKLTAGNGIFTFPDNATGAVIHIQAGGGQAGCNRSNSNSSMVAASGGGGGAYTRLHISKAILQDPLVLKDWQYQVGIGGYNTGIDRPGDSGGYSDFGRYRALGGGGGKEVSASAIAYISGGAGSSAFELTAVDAGKPIDQIATILLEVGGGSGGSTSLADDSYIGWLNTGSHVGEGGGSFFQPSNAPYYHSAGGNWGATRGYENDGHGGGGCGVMSGSTMSGQAGRAGSDGIIIIEYWTQ